MMPWGHFLVGIVPFVGFTLARYRRLPAAHVVVALALGTQFPDIVDKPLAWGLDIIVNGRMFMHSLVFAIPISAAVLVVAARYDARRTGVAFVFGYLVHLPGDFYSAVVGPNTYLPRNLVWPLLGTRPVSEPGFVDQPALLTLSTADIVMLAVVVATVGVACASVCRALLWRPSG